MSSRTNRGRRTTRAVRNTLESQEAKQINLLRQIQLNTNSVRQGTSPMVPDIQLMQVPRNKVYTFARSVQLSNIAMVTNVDTTVALGLSLNDLSASDFVGLFDEYRIIQIRFTFEPFFPQSGTVSPSPIYTAIDVDDAASAGSLAAVLQYDSSQSNPFMTTFSRTLTPSFSLAAYSGAFTSFTTTGAYDQWLDTASPSVIYYGIKLWCPGFTFTGTYGIRVLATAIVQCRHPF